jgi:hypothetical protein
MRRRTLLKSVFPAAMGAAMPGSAAAIVAPASGRAYWLNQMDRVARPVLEALAAGRLRATMPVECAPGMEASRRHTTYLEAVGRLLSGIAPWLELGPADGAEGELRSHFTALVHEGLAVGLDPQAADGLDFVADRQNLVDAAFLALAVLRAPSVLREGLPPKVRRQLAQGLAATRRFTPPQSNWLLFAASVEAALHAMGEAWDRPRVENALQEHAGWYLGDGVYGDGPHFHADYYDSFVIHPFLLAVLEELSGEDARWKAMLPSELNRARRYAAIQERTISMDGTYPVVGRSISYRCGAFHALADAAWRAMLPEDVTPEQARCGLAAVIAKTLGAAGTFDEGGWLRIGLAGHQPALGETYISTGSLYLCSAVFLPLGLPETDRFWSGPTARWTARKVWAGENLRADHALDG